MDVKKIELDFEHLTGTKHRKIIKIIRTNGYQVNIKHYQDYHFFRWCNDNNEFRFFKNTNHKFSSITAAEFIDTFKEVKPKEYIFTERQMNDLLNILKDAKVK